MTKTYHVVGIGNAMVDILCYEDENFLNLNKISKGVMQLIDLTRAKKLHKLIKVSKSMSGGSAANTIAGIAQLGGNTAYIGKVKDDQLGNIFAQDLRNQNVIYSTPFADDKSVDETGRCTIIVTPDGERSMNTYLGVTEYLQPSDIDEQKIRVALSPKALIAPNIGLAHLILERQKLRIKIKQEYGKIELEDLEDGLEF